MTVSTRRWLIALVACLALVVVSIAFVDRPVADWSNAHFPGTWWHAMAIAVLSPLHAVLAAALLFLAVTGVAILRGYTPRPWMRVPLQCAWAMMWAMLAALAMKFVVGRTQVDPPYLVNHVHEFRPFHGSQGYEAFPSATMAVTCAMLAVVWLRATVLRAGCVLAGLMVAAALVITNFHWVGDIVGGSFLGAFIGSLVLRIKPWTGPPVPR